MEDQVTVAWRLLSIWSPGYRGRLRSHGADIHLKRLLKIASSTFLWLNIVPAPKSARDRDGSLLTKAAGEKGLSRDVGEWLSIPR
ncbi:hypothetical protein ELI02_27770 (plasmid) [Rhizobium leguminosarum]|uniref:Uncharacterized protein n=1 Tax=Rhizobium leguminosarum TaxID=384 RepID=A0A4Q8XTA6_RHILE|nr:hypothetical protein ELI40_28855 [Rhizobium leguminosarum]TAU79271.1 hypothetical protein ELI41_32600 [Rhizobium leguminosarum]TAV40768.1 hypothetical protein ELI29_36130 [Rhizobium leguminosarum]TAV81647.1 hypothetical protein ELI22_33510 [Rhizobium leguminosarum]TAV82204.1 hypothetical protein ELI21_33215 [Rhizobium leguminosarum]